MEGQTPIEKDHQGKHSRVRKITVVISVMIVAIMVVGALALVNHSKTTTQSPFLAYPLHVDKYIVQYLSNNSYEFTVWVENQNYSSTNSGEIYCMLNIDPNKGGMGFSSDPIILGPGVRQMFTVWSPENVGTNWTSYDCGIVQ